MKRILQKQSPLAGKYRPWGFLLLMITRAFLWKQQKEIRKPFTLYLVMRQDREGLPMQILILTSFISGHGTTRAKVVGEALAMHLLWLRGIFTIHLMPPIPEKRP